MKVNDQNASLVFKDHIHSQNQDFERGVLGSVPSSSMRVGVQGLLYLAVALAAFALVLFTPSTHAKEWNPANNPLKFGQDFKMGLTDFPNKAELPVLPWPETYFPSKQGSINLRWNQPKPEGFDYDSPSKAQVLRMTREQLAVLSPSEKYDLYLGRYDYPTKKMVDRIAKKTARWWSGLCDGWAKASFQFPEPKPMDFTNPDGVVIPFGSSDIKGLISYYAAIHFDTRTKQVGLRCNSAGRVVGTAACKDIHPASLHLILMNQIGLRKEGFVVEKEPGNQVWNQPVYGYESQIVGSASIEEEGYGAVSAVRVKTKMYYTDELEKSSYDPILGTQVKYPFGALEMEYALELDAAGKIVGGYWFKRTERPDFVWKPTNQIEFKGFFEPLAKIVEAATR